MNLSFGFGVGSYCVSLLLSNVRYHFVCNTYGVGLLVCICILFRLYCNVIVLLLFVIATLLDLRFNCIICVFVFYHYLLLFACSVLLVSIRFNGVLALPAVAL